MEWLRENAQLQDRERNAQPQYGESVNFTILNVRSEYTMDEIEISSLVDKVDRKQMVLPEMQKLNDYLSRFQAQRGA